MTEAITPNITKKLSPESQHLLDELGMISTKAADLIPRIYESLKHDGLEPSEIRGFIESKINIGERRLRQLLPPEAKRDYTIRKKLPNVQKVHNQARLVVDEEPTIPPRPQAVVEIQPEALAEAKRFVDNTIPERPIAVPQKIVKIIFDPAPIDRDRTQVFIIHYDISTNTIKKYETVGRRTIGR